MNVFINAIGEVFNRKLSKTLPLNVLLLAGLLLVGCSKAIQSSVNPNQVLKNDSIVVLDADIPQLVEQQLIVALKLQDYRLFASSGRRTIVVGMDQADLVELKKQCGIKFMPHTGDVLRHKDDGELRKLQLAFAYQYNQKMYPYCQQKSNN